MTAKEIAADMHREASRLVQRANALALFANALDGRPGCPPSHLERAMKVLDRPTERTDR